MRAVKRFKKCKQIIVLNYIVVKLQTIIHKHERIILEAKDQVSELEYKVEEKV